MMQRIFPPCWVCFSTWILNSRRRWVCFASSFLPRPQHFIITDALRKTLLQYKEAGRGQGWTLPVAYKTFKQDVEKEYAALVEKANEQSPFGLIFPHEISLFLELYPFKEFCYSFVVEQIDFDAPHHRQEDYARVLRAGLLIPGFESFHDPGSSRVLFNCDL